MKGLSLSQKIIKQHLVSGEMVKGKAISIVIDQTLTQDSTGTMAYLQFEAMGIPRVKTLKSVAYIDHNMLQAGYENADDHKYIQTVANKYGIYFSKPGNGICHQLHLERFGIPGMTLLGSDSHTPTCGGLGMLAIGAGGLDVAVAMGGGAYHLVMPAICRVNLIGRLKPWVSAKDIILEVLRRLTVKGGVGKIVEYTGDGISGLGVPERATITNMGAELGATSSIFPSDARTREFLKAQGREGDWIGLQPDTDAEYDITLDMDLGQLEPLAAMPHSPDNVVEVAGIAGLKVDQVAIGSCTNSSYTDMMKVARMLRGRTIKSDVSLVISPGSRQVLTMLASNGALADMVAAGARILECSCGPCIGMGQAPATGAVSLRTFNRNFEGRSGTPSAKVCLVSPETAAASALTGYITDPRKLDGMDAADIDIELPADYKINDNMVIPPASDGTDAEVVRGPNIKPFPINRELSDDISGKVLIKTGDNVTTDHIMPSNAKLLPYRSNIPYLSEYCLTPCDQEFPRKAKEAGGGFIVGGANYGQGSSREHAALVPLYLGIKGVITVSFARIHMANLINSGILPLTFIDPSDYARMHEGDMLRIEGVTRLLESGCDIPVENVTGGYRFLVKADLTQRQAAIVKAGGLLNHVRSGGN